MASSSPDGEATADIDDSLGPAGVCGVCVTAADVDVDTDVGVVVGVATVCAFSTEMLGRPAVWLLMCAWLLWFWW